MNGLKKHGYGNSFNYVRGRIQNTKLAGWVGNSSISVENVTYDISIFKSVQDCPLLVALFEHSKFGKRRIRLNFNITKFTHPQGRCCHAIIPVNAEKYHLMELYTEKNVSKNATSAINGFQLYLLGKKVSHIHKLNNFHTNGLPFIVSEKDSGYHNWKVKVQEEFQLEDDPKVSCINYEEERGYAKVCILWIVKTNFDRSFT